MTDPIDKIEWRDAQTLNSNNYNPNVVLNQELKLLELSILQQGWIQPVLILGDGTIIDGFHRATLAKESKSLKNLPMKSTLFHSTFHPSSGTEMFFWTTGAQGPPLLSYV